MYREVDYSYYSKELLRQIPKGVFLNTNAGGNTNTMTIGWGNIGIMWNRPVFTALVRPSRYTHQLIENTGEFTISIPIENDLSDELLICGRKSGRTTDKFSECDLTALKSNTLSTFIVGDCELHFDCKVIVKHETDVKTLPEEIREAFYRGEDMHTLYYAEIVSAYVINQGI